MPTSPPETPPPPGPPAAPPPLAGTGWQRFVARSVELFKAYANWLVSITWKRFFLLSVLLFLGAVILGHLPPFNWRVATSVPDDPTTVIIAPTPPTPPTSSTPVKAPTPPGAAHAPKAAPKEAPAITIEKTDEHGRDITISIGKDGVRISPRHRAPAAASTPSSPARLADAASAIGTAASAAPGAAAPGEAASDASGDVNVEIKLPPGADSDEIRDAVEEARSAVVEAIREARREGAAAAAEAAATSAEVAATSAETAARTKVVRTVRRVRTTPFGDFLTDLAWLIIVASAILKISWKGTVQAEVKAAEATETAESEQLKRQVVEARMAAMQAQVEPHFLFNTLASIDHLIETDPTRASQMQKNLIALLRASMPAMREAHPTAHNLGREMAVIRPYLEILKVRMEDRLQASIDVPDGLLSAEFPTMMIQSLVENAIKHGLEPKPEGGTLKVRAEIIDGKLAVTVADTGLGFGRAPTAGTGVGLANIRDRLKLLYGQRASMVVTDNAPAGTSVTITVPYQAQTAERDAA